MKKKKEYKTKVLIRKSPVRLFIEIFVQSLLGLVILNIPGVFLAFILRLLLYSESFFSILKDVNAVLLEVVYIVLVFLFIDSIWEINEYEEKEVIIKENKVKGKCTKQ